MARATPQFTNRRRPRRNTAPLWKKLAVLLSAPLAVVIVVSLLNALQWSFLPLAILIVVVAFAALWGSSKLLGVHLGIGSWD